jgi:archaellum biogenesis protein FlaJ (TadC family)
MERSSHDKPGLRYPTWYNNSTAESSMTKVMYVFTIALILVITLSIFALYRWAGIPLWAAIVLVVAALFINGLIADIEDRRPGGFLNPSKKRDEKE